MARFVVGAVFGLVVGVVGGAAAGLHADPASPDVAAAAEQVQAAPVDVLGLMATLEIADPFVALRTVGEIPPLVVSKPPPPASVPFGIFDRLAQCESGGNWAAATGNGFLGGLQFLPSTWRANGGVGLPNQASRAEQIRIAQIVQARYGWGQWPACSRALGLR